VLARRVIERTRICRGLRGVRGRAPVKLEELEQLLVQFGQLVVEQRWIREIEINPLLASPEGLIGLDELRGGPSVLIRPIRPQDEPL